MRSILVRTGWIAAVGIPYALENRDGLVCIALLLGAAARSSCAPAGTAEQAPTPGRSGRSHNRGRVAYTRGEWFRSRVCASPSSVTTGQNHKPMKPLNPFRVGL
jgi:hypothetical protein